MEHGKGIETGIIRSNHEVAADHHLLEIELCEAFGDALPGQFVMLRQEGRKTPLLGRPFSICSLDDAGGTVHLEILYRIVGKGTAVMASLRNGDTLSVLGPLGRSFDPVGEARKVALVAGGVGVAPLICYAERARKFSGEQSCEITAYLGARTEESLVGLDRLEALCDEVKIATDDGSRGFKGTVTDLFRSDLDVFRAEDSLVKVCGPKAMAGALARVVKDYGLNCQVSLEERMACGIGVCLGCAVKGVSDDVEPRYLRVCKEGPVFDIGEIDWNDF